MLKEPTSTTDTIAEQVSTMHAGLASPTRPPGLGAHN